MLRQARLQSAVRVGISNLRTPASWELKSCAPWSWHGVWLATMQRESPMRAGRMPPIYDLGDYESWKVRCGRTCSVVALSWSVSQVRDHTWLGPLFTWRGEGHTVIAARTAGSVAPTLGRCYRIAGTVGLSSVIAMTMAN